MSLPLARGSISRKRAVAAGRPLHVLITCEHGGNRIPGRYRPWFAGAEALLASHRGYDPGALAMGRTLAAAASAPLIATTVSRLLVELNRSPHNPRVFSALIRRAPLTVRQEIFERYYVRYHAAVARAVSGAIERGACVLHIGSHTFTPELDGVRREADIGLLYDPARPREAAFCDAWLAALCGRAAGRVRRNYPYEGRNDGLPRVLRQAFGADDYLGIEIEVNQRHPLEGGTAWRQLRLRAAGALRDALQAFEGIPAEPSAIARRRSAGLESGRRSPADAAAPCSPGPTRADR